MNTPHTNDNLKPGDICLIISAETEPENVGKTCELIRLLQPGETLEVPGVPGLRRNGLPYAAWWVFNETFVPKTVHGVKGQKLCGPQHLMKIKGDEQQPREQVADRVRDAEGVQR